MAHKVLITEEAERDLQAIGEFIAVDNPIAAYEMLHRLRRKIESLSDFPKRHRIREDLEGERRVMVVGNYLVVYRVADNTVYVQHITEGSRDLGQLLGEQDP